MKRMFSVNKLYTRIIAALFFLGFTSILIQLILIRELLNLFQGNELIIGLILCLWMLLTASGARLANHTFHNVSKNHLISVLFIFEAIVPFIMVGLLRLTDSLLFPPGTTHGLIMASVYCLIFLLPGCFIGGLLFARLASMLSEIRNKNSISYAYGWESAGSMMAGLLFSLLVAFLLSTFQILALCMIFNLATAWFINSKIQNTFKKAIIPAICIIAALFLFMVPVDLLMKSLHFKNQQILFSRDTPFQNILVTKLYDQVNFYGNNMLLFSTNNPHYAEEAVHYAMLQHRAPKNVLIVSGGIADMSAQVFKYKSVKTLHYLEIDPWLVKAEKKFTNIPDFPGMNIYAKDARKWIRNSFNRYDIVIINSPDPLNAQMNRFYTLDFFREAKLALSPDGVFLISLSSTANYMSTEARDLNRIVFQTLQKAFNYVDIIPGGRNYFVASDDPLRLDIAVQLKQRAIVNNYLTPYLIDDELLLYKNQEMLAEIREPITSVNTDLTPVAYFHQIRYWLFMTEGRKFSMVLWIALLIISLLVFTSICKADPYYTGVFTTGFAGTSSEFLILIIYQCLFGNIYQMTGLIIALYMLGLSCGAMIRKKTDSNSTGIYITSQIIVLLLVALIPVLFEQATKHHFIASWAIQSVLFILITTIAFMAGLAFNKASDMAGNNFIKTAGNLYSVDLAGAASGTIITSMVLLPMAGMWITCFTLAGVILAGLMIMVIFSKKVKFRLP